ncbi:trypsin-like peptidase domain-containing protein [Corynebacterium sp. TA-R-1]|uniref:Trypsin-like peptidase domain-containing protein n=1 Tax=Corynebacterium stercoris TaxID=2943490 RepID=A0ABT1G0X3_9CORY|nr:trypsin-like peptidase domain-containing protein [Corynebacterium stercoris]MCP1387645.1 trypsin-like peptidase domain-containing protein [Corynebacterium stercoris]
MSTAYPPQEPHGTAPIPVTDPYATAYGPTVTQANVEKPKRPSVWPAVAAAVVTSLIVGAGAGYVAGSAGSGNAQQSETQNALEQPVRESLEEAPDGSVEKVAAAVLPTVVSIEVQGTRGVAEGSGSIISSDGYVLTNHHVIEAGASEQSQITVTLNDGSRHPATYVASDVNTDIGVLKIEGVTDLPVIEFGDSDSLRVGQQVVAVGSPLGLSATVTSGIVSALNRPVRAGQGGGESSLMDGIQTDAAINPGNSGGPLVDMQGRLIGMNSVIASLSSGGFGRSASGGSIGLGFAIPSNFAQRVAQQLIERGEATQPMLGVQVSVLESGTDGALISGVQPGSPAEAAGLTAGETVTRLNDRLIDSADALIAATRSRGFGETVTLEVRSPDNSLRTVDVTLSSE